LLLIQVAGAAGVIWIVLNPSPPTLALAGLFYVVCELSVTAGYHSLFAHRTYHAAAPSGGPCSPSGRRRSRTRPCHGAQTIAPTMPTPTGQATRTT